MKKMINIFFLVLLSPCIKAQINLDSLQKALDKEKTDTATFSKYLVLINNTGNDELEVKEMIGNWIITYAVVKEAREILANTYNALGYSFARADDYKKATDYTTKALAIAEKEGYYKIECKSLGILSNIFYFTDQIAKSNEYNNKVIALSEKNNYKQGIALGKFNYAGTISDADNISKDDFLLSKKLKSEALAIVKDLKDTQNIILYTLGLGETYTSYKLFDSAVYIFNGAYPYLQHAANKASFAEYYFILGKNYNLKAKANNNNKADFVTSNRYLDTSLQYAQKFNNTGFILDCYIWMASNYKKMEDYKNAYTYRKLYDDIHDSVTSSSNFKTIADINNRYERAKKDNKIIKVTAENRQKTMLNKILLTGAAAILFISFLGYRNFKSRQKLQQQQITQLEKDKQLLAVDAMLKGQEEERSRLAKDLHDGLGGMLSGVKLSFVNMKENMIMDAPGVQSFEASILQLDNTIAELRKVAHNLMPEALVKFGLKNAVLDFCNSMQLSSKTKIIFEQMGNERQLGNTADLYIYRIIQELINNALKHAKPNQILVQLTKANKNVLLTVENDGKGFNTVQLKDADGIGLKSVQQRVNYFTGKIDINSAETGGTSVNIELNV